MGVAVKGCLGVSALFLMVLLNGCAAKEPGPTEVALREVAGASLAAVSEERWEDVYGFLHPALRDNCSKEQLFAIAPPGITSLKYLFGIQDSERLEYRIVNVSIEGSRGVVESRVFFNGQPLGWQDSSGNLTEEWFSEQWVFMDGSWWPDPPVAGGECAGPGQVSGANVVAA